MKKIMFNDKYCLTEAVLEGSKTMTRREAFSYDGDIVQVFIGGFLYVYADTDGKELLHKSRYAIDEIVAVAQSYEHIYCNEPHQRLTEEYSTLFLGKEGLTSMKGWKNKMFVKADYMQHQIRFTDIKAERLQDITDEECLAEGVLQSNKYVMPFGIYDSTAPNKVFFYYDTPREGFSDLIDRVSGGGTWKSNPYVVAYSFELVK